MCSLNSIKSLGQTTRKKFARKRSSSVFIQAPSSPSSPLPASAIVSRRAARGSASLRYPETRNTFQPHLANGRCLELGGLGAAHGSREAICDGHQLGGLQPRNLALAVHEPEVRDVCSVLGLIGERAEGPSDNISRPYRRRHGWVPTLY